ncbi:G-protein coupled receptor 157-like [Mytilus trossulus]|uniref:G-protein coupled receptor 157-like n=1 Tax=Mytilus trossulus TaxID=6551 RepID=UPI0030050885
MDSLNCSNSTISLAAKITKIDIIVTMATSILSMCGALAIFFTSGFKVYRGRSLSEPRKFLVYLTIADFFLALGYFYGAVRFLRVNSANYEVKDLGCIAQSFVTTMASLCSFWWTSIIAFNFWWTYMCYTNDNSLFGSINNSTRKRTCNVKLWVYHILSWAVPAIIIFTALFNGALGADNSVGSGPWCWISANMTVREQTIWMAVSGKGWEILMYFSCLGFYMLFKFHQMWEIRRQRKIHAQFGSTTPLISRTRCYQQAPEYKLSFIFLWIVEIVLRISGTVRFIMTALRRHACISPSSYEHVDVYLMHFQSFGDCAQAFCSFLIFCVFRRLFRYIHNRNGNTNLLQEAS